MNRSPELAHVPDRNCEPISLQALLGPPPLIQGEDAGGYDELLAASAEVRRSAVLRELERHRASFAQSLRRAIERVEDAEFTLIAPEETSGREAV